MHSPEPRTHTFTAHRAANVTSMAAAAAAAQERKRREQDAQCFSFAPSPPLLTQYAAKHANDIY